MSNDPLIERVRQADAAALAEWLERDRAKLLAMVGREMSDPLRRKVEAEDVLQEVAADAVRALPDVDFTGKDPFGWICELIRRRVVDAHRHHFVARKRSADREVARGSPAADTRGDGLIDMIVASITSPSAAFSRDQKQIRLAAAMEELPEIQRQVLQLRYVDGQPTAEIAKTLGKSHGAIRVLLSRTVQALRERLGEPPTGLH
jgi:RNA polymerase sigma-70 factor (ECF subfamily)